MKVVAGLGNPGREYAGTRHNVGFEVLDRLAIEWGCGWRPVARDRVHLGEGTCAGHRVLLVKPQTFMNCSGEALGPLLRYRQIAPQDLVVVVDDVALDLGRIRIRPKGSSGGHNGLESVIRDLGSDEFVRVRVGVGHSGAGRDLVEHVLGAFSPEERKDVRDMVDVAARAVVCVLESGGQEAMNRYNGFRLRAPEGETDAKAGEQSEETSQER